MSDFYSYTIISFHNYTDKHVYLASLKDNIIISFSIVNPHDIINMRVYMTPISGTSQILYSFKPFPNGETKQITLKGPKFYIIPKTRSSERSKDCDELSIVDIQHIRVYNLRKGLKRFHSIF